MPGRYMIMVHSVPGLRQGPTPDAQPVLLTPPIVTWYLRTILSLISLSDILHLVCCLAVVTVLHAFHPIVVIIQQPQARARPLALCLGKVGVKIDAAVGVGASSKKEPGTFP
eukprot:CAMPEP_0117554822 /NCGR_PEP_ID=MMETSP0784-20121206/50953_1 /TAXON_ID=39447 /ORGANISM="" /LENGTH=111 /DNA_ID=CAMNT_0005352001 /DNA_START=189 /DNA_END=524 /DNA_ORIENTATION=-